MELYNLTISQLRKKLDAKEIKARDIVESVFNRIDKEEDNVKAYVSTIKEKALASAAGQEKIEASMSGIPIAVKDNISTEGIKTTCSSRMLEEYIPPYDATVVKRLKKDGSIIIGKTNMDEYAMGSSTENSAFFPSHNPWNLEHVTGGSSGGSAAAVAADEAPAALGSDTGGSIRQPAAFCGIVGLKPTYGNVSRYGLVAFASSLDQIGPLTKDVRDSATLLNTITGNDPQDSTSVDRNFPDYTDFLKNDVEGMKIGIPEQYFSLDINSEVKESVLAAAKKLEEAGAKLEEVTITDAEYALAAYYIIAPAEASSNLARYDGVRYGFRSEQADDIKTMFTNTRHQGFGDEVKRRIMLGTYALSSGYYDAFYLKAQKVRTIIKNDFDKLFADYDALISPTTPTTAFKIGEVSDPLEMYYGDIFTVPVNIAGIPAISIPCGFDSQKLPIGLQIMGPYFGEGKLLQIAYTLENILNIKDERPNL